MPSLSILAGAAVVIVALFGIFSKLTLAPSALPLLLSPGTGRSLGAIGVIPRALDVVFRPIAVRVNDPLVFFRFGLSIPMVPFCQPWTSSFIVSLSPTLSAMPSHDLSLSQRGNQSLSYIYNIAHTALFVKR